MATTITTIQGDTWDILSKRAYGSEIFMDELIKANFDNRKTVIFPAGVVINIPDIDTETIANDTNLPPWKRAGGV